MPRVIPLLFPFVVVVVICSCTQPTKKIMSLVFHHNFGATKIRCQQNKMGRKTKGEHNQTKDKQTGSQRTRFSCFSFPVLLASLINYQNVFSKLNLLVYKMDGSAFGPYEDHN